MVALAYTSKKVSWSDNNYHCYCCQNASAAITRGPSKSLLTLSILPPNLFRPGENSHSIPLHQVALA